VEQAACFGYPRSLRSGLRWTARKNNTKRRHCPEQWAMPRAAYCPRRTRLEIVRQGHRYASSWVYKSYDCACCNLLRKKHQSTLQASTASNITYSTLVFWIPSNSNSNSNSNLLKHLQTCLPLPRSSPRLSLSLKPISEPEATRAASSCKHLNKQLHKAFGLVPCSLKGRCFLQTHHTNQRMTTKKFQPKPIRN
jgi:hypothetical protein